MLYMVNSYCLPLLHIIKPIFSHYIVIDTLTLSISSLNDILLFLLSTPNKFISLCKRGLWIVKKIIILLDFLSTLKEERIFYIQVISTIIGEECRLFDNTLHFLLLKLKFK
jgi:hypothetical protein